MTSIKVWLAANSVMLALNQLCFESVLLNRLFLYRAAALEHFEHAVGDEKSADYVARGGDDGDHSQDSREGAFLFAHQNNCADDGYGIEGVGQRHEGSVQQWRHVADHFESDESRQHEDEQRVDQIGTHVLPLGLKPLSSADLPRPWAALPRRYASRWCFIRHHRPSSYLPAGA